MTRKIALTPDSAVPNTAIPNTAIPDTAIPDTAIPDTAIPDTAIPDTAIPDTAIPDTAVPDSAVPDSAVPDSAVPDSAVPDSAVPDSAVPDSAVPDSAVPNKAGSSATGPGAVGAGAAYPGAANSVAANSVAADSGAADSGAADSGAADSGAADSGAAIANPSRARWEEHYASGHTPWDTQITPPEVRDFWASGRLPLAGLALDVGCGTGTNVRYLAQLGLQALGFDLAYAAVATGRTRTYEQAPHLRTHAHLVQADVTRLPLTAAGAAYILDLGCSHGIPPELRDRYAAGVIANLRPGGYYHLYAFDYVPRPEAEAQERHMGMHDDEVVTRFTPALEVVEILRATPDRYPCRWYLLRKP